ncbi:hypothetical protein Pan153_09630 [Gimesia panareensis]|uniref:Uncharacterized protein n=1 Tax=Gimesia panareensis TaxID=2527978 RepID=A0A518FJ14_9PLAN|nr:hypothetical protein [Gimesia panareensis]QDV16336.1 hypothetical protein Pan153_09630 [Gimesia panareensis]
MLAFFRSIYLTRKYRSQLQECEERVLEECFAGMERGWTFLDGMTAILTVFLYGKVVREENGRLFIRFSFHLKDKGFVEAHGIVDCVYENGVVSEIRERGKSC